MNHNKDRLINIGKIITNIVLILCLLITLYVIIEYKNEVREVVGGADPERIIGYYFNRTGKICYCDYPGNNLIPSGHVPEIIFPS